MDAIADILTVDNLVAVSFLIFLVLWHNRTVNRDKQFFQTMQDMIKLLSDCQDDLGERKPTPRD